MQGKCEGMMQCRMEAVLVVQQPADEPSIVFSACADGHVLRWELDADLNADSYKCAPPCCSLAVVRLCASARFRLLAHNDAIHIGLVSFGHCLLRLRLSFAAPVYAHSMQ